MAARVRAPLPGLRAGACTASAETAHYLTRVLRLGAGSAFVAFDPETAQEADAAIVSVAGEVQLQVGPPRPARVTAARGLTFVQGLAKGDKCDAVVRDATELGATKVIIAACARSVVQLDGAKRDARIARWTRIAREAARQCGRADPPAVFLLSWPMAIDEVGIGTIAFCLHPHLPGGAPGALSPLGAASPPPLGPLLLAALADENASIAFAAGPEGGLTDEEVTSAASRGWRIASLGKSILRTETAAAAVLGAVRVFDAT